METMITFGDMKWRGMRMLEVACRRCERRGRLRIDKLIAQHGRDDHGDLRALIAHDCPADAEPVGLDLRTMPRSLPKLRRRFSPLRRFSRPMAARPLWFRSTFLC
jgi:hypothetical protein